MIFQSARGAYIRINGKEVLRIEPPTIVDSKIRVEIANTLTASEADAKYETEQDTALRKTGYHSHMHTISIEPLKVALWIGPIGNEPPKQDWWIPPKVGVLHG